MPIELLDKPQLAEPSRQESNGLIPDLLDDEFNNRDVRILRPLSLDPTKINYSTYEGGLPQLNRDLRQDFEYYSRTRVLEFNTDRTAILQDLVDKMTRDDDMTTQVVIMNKGSAPNAFVYPDGTIFVSQSLLNKLDTLDEVAAALGHELGHLIHGTTFRKAAHPGVGATGIAWVHEEACDLEGRRLPEKAGFNSLAFGSMIEKVQGMERDVEHQSGFSRASTNVGSHFFVDSRTSDTERTPIPNILHDEFKRDNLEMIRGSIRSITPEVLRGIAEKLHPRDLANIYSPIWSACKDADITSRQDDSSNQLKVLNEIIIERLEEAGYSRADAILTLISLPNDPYRFSPVKIIADLLDTPESLNDVVQRLNYFENHGLYREMYESIFSVDPKYRIHPTSGFLSLLGENMYDSQVSPEGKGIPVTQETVLDILATVNNTNFQTNHRDYKPEMQIAIVVSDYIKKAFTSLNTDNEREVDETRLRDFFIELKSRGINFSSEQFIKIFQIRISTGISATANTSILRIYSEIFDVPIKSGEFGIEEIDQFFEKFERTSEESREDLFLDFLKEMYKQTRQFSRTPRSGFIDYIDYKINQLSLDSRIPLLDYLNGEGGDPENWRDKNPTPEEQQINKAIRKFNMKIIMAMTSFSSYGNKGEETNFLNYSEKVMLELIQTMGDLGINLERLSKVQLINLCQPFFFGFDESPEFYGVNSIHHIQRFEGSQDVLDIFKIYDYSYLFKLPLFQRIVDMEEDIQVSTMQDLLDYTNNYLTRLHIDLSGNDKYSFFSDDAQSLILGRAIVKQFNQILDQGIPSNELDKVYEFVNLYFPDGVQKDEFLRGLQNRFLKSENVSLDQKTEYLLKYLDQIGYEGILTVVAEIHNIDTYRNFRRKMIGKLESYLNDPIAGFKLASVDFIGAGLAYRFETLLETAKADPESKKRTSNELAYLWLEGAREPDDSYSGYDKESGKYIVAEGARETFKSLADSFSMLDELSRFRRFALVHKALLDTNGALTSSENRQKLADLLVSALGLKKGFVTEVLSAAVKQGDAGYIGFPASNMLTPLLFRALDLDTIDTSKVFDRYVDEYEEPEFSREDLPRIFNSTTRDITLFGSYGREDPSSKAAAITEESDHLYYETVEKLRGLIGVEVSSQTEIQPIEDIDPGTEAIIKGVESGGALGYRTLQFASQFYTFSPELDKRLSETFDSNPGMNRFVFWENLNKLTTDNPDNIELEDFLQRMRLGEYKGGGSLQTSYAATLTMDDGKEKPIIIKRKNPNVVALLRETYRISHQVLDTVSREGDRSSQIHAKTGMLLLDLAQEWCIADVNDKTYTEDDDLFRQTVAKYNQEYGRQVVYVPERVLTQSEVKSEDLAPGRTVNQILKDDSVDLGTKREIVSQLREFFLYQMRDNSFTNSEGKRYFLVHSDPHVGNYMVDVESGKPIQVGVIDRSMYLKLEEGDVKALEKLFGNGNPNDFVYSFIDRVLDINKVRRIERLKVTARVFANVAKEFTSQLTSGGVNKFALLQTLLKELSDQSMVIPLNLRLMVRNISALQELLKRYDLPALV